MIHVEALKPTTPVSTKNSACLSTLLCYKHPMSNEVCLQCGLPLALYSLVQFEQREIWYYATLHVEPRQHNKSEKL